LDECTTYGKGTTEMGYEWVDIVLCTGVQEKKVLRDGHGAGIYSE
jgi:hypothetical protein